MLVETGRTLRDVDAAELDAIQTYLEERRKRERTLFELAGAIPACTYANANRKQGTQADRITDYMPSMMQEDQEDGDTQEATPADTWDSWCALLGAVRMDAEAAEDGG